jgi:hypothetical protein
MYQNHQMNTQLYRKRVTGKTGKERNFYSQLLSHANLLTIDIVLYNSLSNTLHDTEAV